MKTLKLIGLAFALLFLLPSCNKSEGDYPQWRTITTVRISLGGSYYFELDNGKTMFPSVNHLSNYPAKDGQRVAVYFNYLEEKVNNFDYNISLYALNEILTKDVKFITTQEELDALGNDGINVSGGDMYIGKEYLTLAYYIPMYNYNEKHEFNLAVDQIITPIDSENDSEYSDVLLRHNANAKTDEYSSLSYISFRLNAIHPSMTGKKGLRIHVKQVNGEVKTFEVDYKAGEAQSFDLK